MQTKFQNHIVQKFPFLLEKKVFIAVSGGVDSMVLVDLFQKLGIPFTILHCNFNLRGAESEAETQFIRDFGRKNNIPYIIHYFETEKYAHNNKLSIQLAARELRYNWFQQEVRNGFLLTAHHADDNVETFLINLSRGTGIDGLTGIPEQNEYIIRPLLPFSRSEIAAYATQNGIEWKEDSSNASDKYLRNKIRHQIVPLLKELHPTFLENFQKTQHYLQGNQQIVENVNTELYKQIVEKNDKVEIIPISKLLQYSYWETLLYYWLKPKGFTAWDDIYALVFAQSGKKVLAENTVLLKNREHLLLYSEEPQNNLTYKIEKNEKSLKVPLNMQLLRVENATSSERNSIFVDEDLLEFPLEVRKWKQGDYFFPSGMKGKKKVSKYFKDEKYSLYDKENQWVLISGEKIVWIIGKRADERFMVNRNTQHILKIEIKE